MPPTARPLPSPLLPSQQYLINVGWTSVWVKVASQWTTGEPQLQALVSAPATFIASLDQEEARGGGAAPRLLGACPPLLT